MTIEKNVCDTTVTFSLEGRLDTTTAPRFEEQVMVAAGDASDLVLDFSRLDYISSAGLRVLLKAQKAMTGKGTMKVTHVNAGVMEVFDITGFTEILTIE